MLASGLRILRLMVCVMTFSIISGSPLYAAGEPPSLGILDTLVDGQTLTYADYGQLQISTFRIVKRPDGITLPDFQMWFSKAGIVILEATGSSRKKVSARIAAIDENCIYFEYSLYKKDYKRQRYCLFGNKLWSSNFYVGNPITTRHYYINPDAEQSALLRKEGARLASLKDPNSSESIAVRELDRNIKEEVLADTQNSLASCRGSSCVRLKGQEAELLDQLGRPNGYAAAQEAESAATLAAGLNIIVAGAQANADRMTRLRQRSIDERQTQLRAASRANAPAYASAEPAMRTGDGAFGALPTGVGNDPQRAFWATRCQGKPNDASPAAQGCQQSWQQITSTRSATTRASGSQNAGVVTTAQSSPTSNATGRYGHMPERVANSCTAFQPAETGRIRIMNRCGYEILVASCPLGAGPSHCHVGRDDWAVYLTHIAPGTSETMISSDGGQQTPIMTCKGPASSVRVTITGMGKGQCLGLRD